jgi:hypothetical protein
MSQAPGRVTASARVCRPQVIALSFAVNILGKRMHAPCTLLLVRRAVAMRVLVRGRLYRQVDI